MSLVQFSYLLATILYSSDRLKYKTFDHALDVARNLAAAAKSEDPASFVQEDRGFDKLVIAIRDAVAAGA